MKQIARFAVVLSALVVGASTAMAASHAKNECGVAPIKERQTLMKGVGKGPGVSAVIYAIHRNPTYWDAPDIFDPERFTATRSKGRPAHAFLPFGEGPRMCVGSRFAMTEACLMLATLAQRWRFEIEEPAGVRPDTRFVLKPASLSATVMG